MKRMGRLVAVVLCASALSGCGGKSPEVHAYVDAAIKPMNRGILADTAAWRKARDTALPRLYAAKNIPGTHTLLQRLAVKAGGAHSSFQPPKTVSKLDKPFSPKATFELPKVAAVDGLGVLTIPTYLGSDPRTNRRYERAAAKAISANYADVSCGWIIDLSTNVGGTTWPMLAAASPLLDNGRVLSFVDRAGGRADVTIDGTVVRIAGKVVASLGANGIPKMNTMPIAILQNQSTASAAEAVVIAFAGQASAKSFGQSTQGLSSVNATTSLSDGSRLVITQALDADRTGKTYGGRVEPDVRTPPNAAGGIAKPAIAWLRSQCSPPS